MHDAINQSRATARPHGPSSSTEDHTDPQQVERCGQHDQRGHDP